MSTTAPLNSEQPHDLLLGLAIGFTVTSTVLYIGAMALAHTILRNFRLIIFRSLGRPYIYTLAILVTCLQGVNLGAIWNLPFQHDEARVILENGTLTGIRTFFIAVLFSAFTSRQFMLSRIFGTVGTSRRQFFLPPVIVAVVIWLPILLLFYLALFNLVDLIIYAACLFVFYFVYLAFFIYFAVKNRHISKIFSDYIQNVLVVAWLILCLLVSIWLVVQYQLIVMDTYIFEVSVTIVLGVGSLVSIYIALVPPVWKWAFSSHAVEDWENFNKRNAFVYGRRTSSTLETAPSDAGLTSMTSADEGKFPYNSS